MDNSFTLNHFQYMLEHLISAEVRAVSNLERLCTSERRVTELERQVQELEYKLSLPKPSNPATLPVESLTDLMLGDRNKIAAIKVVRTITGMGLKESKELVEAATAAAQARRQADTTRFGY